MVPIILAGAAVARLVTPILAKKLIRDGIGKAASKSIKISPDKPITNMNQLPKDLYKPTKPSTLSKNTGKRTQAQHKELMERTRKNREGIKKLATPKPKVSSVPIKIPKGVQQQAKMKQKIASESAQKLKGAEQIQGVTKQTPSNKKGMLLPRKGETVKRYKGGKIVKKSKGGFMGKGAGCALKGY
jgi:hypothetical protein